MSGKKKPGKVTIKAKKDGTIKARSTGDIDLRNVIGPSARRADVPDARLRDLVTIKRAARRFLYAALAQGVLQDADPTSSEMMLLERAKVLGGLLGLDLESNAIVFDGHVCTPEEIAEILNGTPDDA